MYKKGKQMCWCFKVFFRVFGNLTSRLFTDCLDASYKMCVFCCRCKKNNEADRALADLIKQPREDFYKEIGREAAEKLLEAKQNGTFIIRPSKNSKVGVLTVIQDAKIFHLNIRKREEDGLIALGTEKSNEKCFKDLNCLINYYISNYLVLYSRGEKTCTLLLPYREKKNVEKCNYEVERAK